MKGPQPFMEPYSMVTTNEATASAPDQTTPPLGEERRVEMDLAGRYPCDGDDARHAVAGWEAHDWEAKLPPRVQAAAEDNKLVG